MIEKTGKDNDNTQYVYSLSFIGFGEKKQEKTTVCIDIIVYSNEKLDISLCYIIFFYFLVYYIISII